MNLDRVAKALVHTDAYNVDDVARMVRAGQLSVWEADDMTVLTQVVDYPRFKAGEYFLMTGDVDRAMDSMQSEIEAFHRRLGCSRMRAEGRLAWARRMAPHGWYANAVIYRDLV